MNNKLTLIFAFICLVFSCSSTKPSGGSAETNKEKPTSAKQFNGDTDNGKTVELTVGETFDVTFYKECVGCAEVWHVVNRNEQLIDLRGQENIRAKMDEKMVGGSSTHVFHFKALKSGTTDLTFSYFEQSFILKILVK